MRVTVDPAQIAVDPLVDMVGVAGKVLTTTLTPDDTPVQPAPLVTVTVYVPDVVTDID